MTKKQKLHRIAGFALSISLLVAGLSLIRACLGIYDSGSGTFSREAVAEAFSPIAFFVFLCLGLAVLGILLDIFLPAEERKPKVQRQPKLILQRLHARTDLSKCPDALRAAVETQQEHRRLHTIIRNVLIALSAIVFFGYVISGDRFLLPDINSSMVRAMAVLLPCLAVTFGYAVFTAWHSTRSMEKEIDLLRQAPAEAAIKSPVSEKKQPARRGGALRWAVLVLAVALIVFGYNIGGTADVLTKAINICTECVGLG